MRRPAMKRQGFSLLEVMVATVIMAIAVVGLLSGITGSLRTADRLTDHHRAALVARANMDELLLDFRLPRMVPMQGPIDPDLMSGARSGWRARVSAFERSPFPFPGARVLDRVELEIWWERGAQRRGFLLDGYRVNTLRPEEMESFAQGGL